MAAAAAGSMHEIERDMTRVTFDVISATLLPSADATVGPAIEGSAGLFQKAGRLGAALRHRERAEVAAATGAQARSGSAIRMLRSSVAAMLRERGGRRRRATT